MLQTKASSNQVYASQASGNMIEAIKTSSNLSDANIFWMPQTRPAVLISLSLLRHLNKIRSVRTSVCYYVDAPLTSR